MRIISDSALPLFDYAPDAGDIRQEVLQGLTESRKYLPSKLFYDEHGSQLFDQITELDEYYPTRTELEIMRQSASEMAAVLGRDCLLVEYGSGSSLKIRLLLDVLENPAAYVPIDISKEHLVKSALRLASEYPNLQILPVCADYTSHFELPKPKRKAQRKVIYFPGSTIGNLEPFTLARFLRDTARQVESGGGFLVGIDLKKDPEILHKAYNDAAGVTAEFNLNMLERLNRELQTNFRLDQFRHYAFYNPPESRIEMHILSLQEQQVQLGDTTINFKLGESIWTESSYKYNLTEFAQVAAKAGFKLQKSWTDPAQLFGVVYLTVE